MVDNIEWKMYNNKSRLNIKQKNRKNDLKKFKKIVDSKWKICYTKQVASWGTTKNLDN